MLEEGSLPIRQALDDDAALAEERRLLYVGITRARVHLALSWAERFVVPVLLGIVIAYTLNPLVVALQRLHLHALYRRCW